MCLAFLILSQRGVSQRVPIGTEHSALKESKWTRNSENRKGFLEEELVDRIQRMARIEQGKPVLCPLYSSGSLMAFNCAYLAGNCSIFFGGGAGCWIWNSIFLQCLLLPETAPQSSQASALSFETGRPLTTSSQ